MHGTDNKSETAGQGLASIEEILEEARNGRMFILVDDEDRENEGDLIIPAQMATPDAIAFMATHGRGLICLSLTRERCEQLNLQLMPSSNQSRLGTAFTLSIEAREGVTTGISAADRARTISVAIDPSHGQHDIATPGHVFPLMARDGGVLVRAGHTEAAVDIARMAGLLPAGVICEVMKEDGTMARMPDLLEFAAKHDIKIATIEDLIAYRRVKDSLVVRGEEKEIETDTGSWTVRVYRSTMDNQEHLALIKGRPDTSGPVLVRAHALNVVTDVLGGSGGKNHTDLHAAMDAIDKAGAGIVILLRDSEPMPFTSALTGRRADGYDGAHPRLMTYGVGAQILLDLGVRDMTLISNTNKTIIGLEGYGLHVSSFWALPGHS